MASRSLDHLRSDVRARAKRHIEACEAEGIDLLVYCTYRSNVEQDIEFAKGRTIPGSVVTNARGGQSKHNHMEAGIPASLAYDCIPVVNGKAQWSNVNLINKVGLLGEGVGMVWAGRWRGKLREAVHFEAK
jgi:peptidoglycan L-alanyl-D-glutamate endopeptidase CwlK